MHGHAQNLRSQLGKLLRIDPRPSAGRGHTVPPDNPYAGRTDVARTIWGAGLRNPFRFSFDRGTGDLVVADVGQGAREELTYVRHADGLRPGGNFGWPCFEGLAPGPRDCTATPHLAPAFDYSQASPRAVAGGYVVRDPGLPTLLGRYVYADTYEGEVRSLRMQLPAASGARLEGLPNRSPLVSFGEDACGHVYVVSLAGTVDRIQDGAPGRCVLKPEPAPLRPPPDPDPDPEPSPEPSPEPTPVNGVTPPPPVVDRDAPVVEIAVAGRRSALARRRLRLTLEAREPAAFTVGGRLRGIGRLRTARATVAAGGQARVSVRFSRTSARRLRAVLRRRGRAIAALEVVARDAAGNETLTRRRVVLRR